MGPSLAIKTSFDPASGELANAIAQAMLGQNLSTDRAQAIIKKCYRIALMSAGKLLRNSMRAAMRGETIPIQPRAQWRGQWDIATVLRSIRPLKRARSTKRGRDAQALRVMAAGYGRTPLPMFGRLQNAVQYQFNERSGWLRVGFLRDTGSLYMSRLQGGEDIDPGSRWNGSQESMRRYWGALGMPIPRSRTSFKLPPRPVVEPVFEASQIQNHLEQRFIRALQEKLS